MDPPAVEKLAMTAPEGKPAAIGIPFSSDELLDSSFDAEFGIPPVDKLPTLESILNDDDYGGDSGLDKHSLLKDESRSQTSQDNHVASDKLSAVHSDSNSLSDSFSSRIKTSSQNLSTLGVQTQKEHDTANVVTLAGVTGGEENEPTGTDTAAKVIEPTSDTTALSSNVSASNNSEGTNKQLPENGGPSRSREQAVLVASATAAAAMPPSQSENVVPVKAAKRGSTAINAHLVKLEEQVSLRNQIVSAVDRVDAGLPSAIATSQNGSIAVGTSHGVVLVFDATQVLRFCVGNRNVGREYGGVSCLCFNRDSTRLLVGYAKGQMTMWDMTNGKLLRNMMEAHQDGTAVLHVRFTDDSTLAICNDSGGSVYALHFKRLIGRSWETVCLFSGSRGEVCAIEPLTMTPTFKDHPFTDVCVLAMASFSKIFVVTLIPEMTVRFVHPLRGEPGTLPLLDWRIQVVPQSGKSGVMTSDADAWAAERSIQPLLAFARDRHLNLVQLVFRSHDEIRFGKPKSLEFAFQLIAIRFVNQRLLVAIDTHERIHIVDYLSAELLTSVSLDTVQLVYATSHFKAIATGSNVSRALALAAERACYHSVALADSRDTRVLLLGMRTVYSVVLQSWDQRVNLLVKENKFREALELCKSCFDGTAKAVVGLGGSRRRELVGNKLLEVLVDFVDAAMKRLCPERGNYAALRSHYESIVPVIVDYALLLSNTEVLFEVIFKKLRSDPIANEIFLDSLDRHAADDRLTNVPTHIVNELLQHYQSTRRTDKMEVVLTHLDCSELDIQHLLTVCRQFVLDDALIHLYTKVLSDYVTPLRELLDRLGTALRHARNDSKRLSDETVRCGNRVLVYISSCMCGRAYPTGDIPPGLISIVREQIYELLVAVRLPPRPLTKSRTSRDPESESLLSVPSSPTEDDACSTSGGDYPYVRTLLHFDVRDFLNVLALVFDDAQLGAPRRQKLMDVMLHLMTETVDFSPEQIGVLFIFAARQLSRHPHSISIPKALLDQIVEYLCTVDAPVYERRCSFDAPHSNLLASQLDDDGAAGSNETRRPRAISLAQSLERQQVLIDLIAVDSPVRFDERWLLMLAERARFYRVCELIYERQRRFDKVLACYLQDTSKRDTVFIYTENVLGGEQYTVTEQEKNALRVELLGNAQQLLAIDADRFAQLTVTFTPLEKMLNLLHGHAESTYRFLKAFFKLREAALQQQPQAPSRGLSMQPSIGMATQQNVAVNISPETYESFIELLCCFESESAVLRSLQSYETQPFRTQQTIAICERAGYLECVAFLYESIDNIARAAQIHRANLEARLQEATAILLGQTVHDSNTNTQLNALKIEETVVVNNDATYNRVLERVRLLVVSIMQFCQRVSRRLEEKARQSVWFALFDTVKQAYLDVRTAISNPASPSISEQSETNQRMLPDPSGSNAEGSLRIKWITMYASELRALTSDVLNMMVTHVSLPVVLHKLIQDPLYAVNRFGEIRDLILGMLDTYNYERTLLDACNSMMTRDLLRQIRRMQLVTRSSFPVRKLRCSLCRGPPSDEQDVSEYELVVFKCGHLYHSECLRSFASQSGAQLQGQAGFFTAASSQRFDEVDSDTYALRRSNDDPSWRCPFCLALGRSRSVSRHVSSGQTTPRTVSGTDNLELTSEERSDTSILLSRAGRAQSNVAPRSFVKPNAKSTSVSSRVDPIKYSAFRRVIDTSNSFGSDKLPFLNELSQMQKDRSRSGSSRNPFHS